MAHEHNQQKLMQKNIVSFFWFAFSWLPFIGKLIFLNQEDRQTDAKAQTLI
jgi:hypothetical protein